MGKRRNLKRRDNEVEGEGSGSDVTLSAVENEHDSAEESDMGAREGLTRVEKMLILRNLWDLCNLRRVFRYSVIEMRILSLCSKM